eukprot:1315294-Amorphochlora_amoeboformis.AAC.1
MCSGDVNVSSFTVIYSCPSDPNPNPKPTPNPNPNPNPNYRLRKSMHRMEARMRRMRSNVCI